MNLITMGQYEAERLSPRADWHVISIRSPGNPAAMIANKFGACTFVAMADDDSSDPDAVHKIARAAMAAYRANAETLVVHCEMGVSRSVGVARAIAQALELTYANDFRGNRTVRHAVALALDHL